MSNTELGLRLGSEFARLQGKIEEWKMSGCDDKSIKRILAARSVYQQISEFQSLDLIGTGVCLLSPEQFKEGHLDEAGKCHYSDKEIEAIFDNQPFITPGHVDFFQTE